MTNPDDPTGGPPQDDDPFKDNPDLEFAATMAMTAIPGPDQIPGGPGGATPNPNTAPNPYPGPQPGAPHTGAPPAGAPHGGYGGGQPGFGPPSQQPGGGGPQYAPMGGGPGGHSQPRPVPRRPEPTVEKSFGISSVMAALGGIGIMVAFFLPMLSGGYITDEVMSEAKFLPAELLFDEEDVPDDLEAEVAAGRAALEAIGFDDFFLAFQDADDKVARQDLIREYGISPFQTMRFFQVLDFDSEVLDADDELKAGSRVFWISLIWMVLSGLFGLVFAVLRGFKPLNAFQIAWSGLFGLMWLLAGVGMLLVDESKEIGGVDLTPFQGVGIYVLLGAAGLMWLSAFAGLSTRNWWKAPLFGLLLIVLVGASTVVPAVLLTS